MKFDTDSVKTKYLLKLLYWQSLGSSAIKPQFTGKILFKGNFWHPVYKTERQQI